MFSFFKRRGFLVFVGFLLLALAIWFAGPYLAFADVHPLEPESARIIFFLAILGLWILRQIWKRIKAYRASDRLLAAVVQQTAKEQPSAEAVQLRERFEQAVGTLKQSRRGGHSLYDLPWYVIIGAPGSGKTTALLNSGLKFPLEQRSGRGAIRGIGGTRNCDWWFTDEAVFLDTAGRYTTHDSDATSDQAGWTEFLALLKKYRSRRPLNGVILTISAHDLMLQGEHAREGYVEAARRRLEELNRDLRIQLPVYVMVTKCDLVAGFSEYFDDLNQEGRAQVWGVTFPYERTADGTAAELFPEEFDQLIARLNARVLARVEEDRDVRRRTRIFAFPQQMAALRGALTAFVADVFTATRMDRQVLLRGVYLTSGTQEGTPIDRLLGAISRRYGVAADAVVPPTGRGKAYFVERLLKEVVIGESGLAGLNRRLEVKKAALQLGGYAAMALLAVAGLFVLSISYSRNRDYISEVSAAIEQLDAVPPVVATTSPHALLPRLDAIGRIVEIADQYRESAPWSMRWGLFQGSSVGNAARDAYVRELDGTLLPRLAGRIEERLVEYAPDPEKLYEYLKAYLMLNEPKVLNKDHLQFVARLEFSAADHNNPEAAARLAAHFQSLLDYGDSLRPVGVNDKLVSQARNSIARASIPEIIYSRLKREYQEDRARTVRLDLAAGIGVEEVLRRRSGAPLSQPVPSFFSRGVFQEVATRQVPEIVKSFAAEDWVWGDGGSASRTSTRLSADVIDMYERDYIETWDGVLNDFELVPFSTPDQAAAVLGRLSGPTSPLRGLLAAVAENTTLVDESSAKDVDAAAAAKKTITDRFRGAAVADKLSSLFRDSKGAPVATRKPGLLVTAEFQPVHRLLQGDPGNTPLDRVLLRVGQVQVQLRAMSGGGRIDMLANPELREIVRSLQQEAEGLPPILQHLIDQLGRRAETTVVSGAASELERRYREEVQRECATTLAGRYPFTPGSTTDLPLKNFSDLFGFNGVFDKFFNDHLEAVVDRSTSPWRWKSGAPQGPGGILDQFAAALRIRDLFFNRRTGALELRFHVTMAESDANSIRLQLEVDGQVYEYRVPVRQQIGTWPGPNVGTSAVTWFEKYGAQPRLAFLGHWSLFRLIDAAHQQRESDVRMNLTFDHQGHRAKVMFDATSIDNPFLNREWQRFSCHF